MLEQLPLPAVLAACREQTERYRCGAANDARFCLELWRRALDLHDPDAWYALVDQYSALIGERLRAGGFDNTLIEETIQQTFINLWLKSRAGAFSAEGRTLPEVLQYLLNCMRYTAVAVRRQQRDLPLQASADSDAVARDRTSEVDARLDAQKLLAHIRAELKLHEWCVLQLRYLEDMPPREIATVLGMTVDQIYLILADIKRRLRARSDLRRLRDQILGEK
jgi:RNA polymerase sigma factor (sigma-70 family)